MLKKVRLELARDHDFPEGSRFHGYEFVAPLDENGFIDAAAWRNSRERCRVRRFWGDVAEDGHLVHKPGGRWAFHYDVHGDPEDDESGYRFASHPFVLGEYVSVREHDDDRLRTFRIVRVDDL
jgi:hypothetical protein